MACEPINLLVLLWIIGAQTVIFADEDEHSQKIIGWAVMASLIINIIISITK